MEEKITLSAVDIERKYEYEYEEGTYGNNSIVSYGKDNAAPILYRNCYRNSATLKSIIDGSVNYILGEEVIVNDNAATFKDKVNRNGMTMRQFIANIALSYQIYGGFAFQVIYNKLGIPVELFPLDFSRCRTNEYCTKVFYSKKNWTKYQTKAEEYDVYNREKINMENPTQIFYFKGDFTTSVYPFPPYYAAIKDVLTEIEASRYSLNSVSNGFSARYIINIPNADNLTDEQRGLIKKNIKDHFCGPDTDSNFMLYFTNNKEGLNVQKIETDDANERYINIKNAARENIFISMRATPALFGLPNVTNGFSTNEYSDSYKLFDKTVIQPIRESLIESINKVIGVDAVVIRPFVMKFDDNNNATNKEMINE